MRFRSHLMFVLTLVMLSVGLANAQGDEPPDEEVEPTITQMSWILYRECLRRTREYQDTFELIGFDEDISPQYTENDAYFHLILAYVNALCEVYIEHYQAGIEHHVTIAATFLLSVRKEIEVIEFLQDWLASPQRPQ